MKKKRKARKKVEVISVEISIKDDGKDDDEEKEDNSWRDFRACAYVLIAFISFCTAVCVAIWGETKSKLFAGSVMVFLLSFGCILIIIGEYLTKNYPYRLPWNY